MPNRRVTVSSSRDKYQQGVRKMVEMQEKLATLRERIAAMEPELQRSKVEVELLMTLINQVRALALRMRCRRGRIMSVRALPYAWQVNRHRMTATAYDGPSPLLCN